MSAVPPPGRVAKLIRRVLGPRADGPPAPGPAAPAGTTPAATVLQLTHFALVHERSNDAVLLIHADGRIRAANPRALGLYGYAREQLLQMRVDDLRAPGTPERREAAALFEKTLREGAVLFETVHRRSDGTLLPVEISSLGFVLDGERYVQSIVRDITQRRRDAEALRESEARYRSLFEQASEGIFLLTTRHRYLEANAAGLAMLGYDRETLARMSLLDVLAPCERSRIDGSVAEMLGGVSQRGLWQHVRQDGSTFVAEVSAAPIDGERYMAILRDQTEIIETRRQLEHQRDLYDLLSQSSQAIVRMQDRASLFGSVVRLAVERGRFLFAWIATVEADGSVVASALHGEDHGYVASLGSCASVELLGQGPTGQALRTGQPVVCNDFLGDESTQPWHAAARRAGVRSSAAVPLLQRGRVAGALMLYAGEPGYFTTGIVRTLCDMADDLGYALDALSTRRELDESRHLLQSVIDASASPIYAFDLEGRFLMLNDACARALGCPRDEAIGRTRRQLLSAEVAAPFEATDRRVARERRSLTVEETAVVNGSARPYLSIRYPLFDTAGRLYAVGGISTDITELRRMQRQLEATNEELELRVAERTQELAAARDLAKAADRAKSGFLATMSHELRSPLNSIIGFTSILLDGMVGPLNDTQRRQLTIVSDASRHLLGIISDLLDISKIEAGVLQLDREPFELQPLIERILERYAHAAGERGLSLGQAGPPLHEAFVGDERRVEQILGNLVSNAVKYTDTGSITVEARRAGAEVAITVRDSGPGIAPHDQQRLFRNFSQINQGPGKLNEGSGLGLAISAGLAAAMGGRIELESVVGSGSAFTLLLSLHRD